MLLYSFAPQDRSGRIRWLLKELGVPFETRTLDGEANEHKEPEFLALNPMGFVPVLVDGERTLFESASIALYLTEKEQALAPAPGSPARADFLKWLVFASTTLDPHIYKVFKTHDMGEEERQTHLSYIASDFRETGRQLEKILSMADYVAGGEFSAADIMLAQPLDWARRFELLQEHPAILKYLERLKGRPACIEAEIFKGR